MAIEKLPLHLRARAPYPFHSRFMDGLRLYFRGCPPTPLGNELAGSGDDFRRAIRIEYHRFNSQFCAGALLLATLLGVKTSHFVRAEDGEGDLKYAGRLPAMEFHDGFRGAHTPSREARQTMSRRIFQHSRKICVRHTEDLIILADQKHSA